MGTSMVNPDLRRKIKVKVRPDLVVKKQKYAGQTYYIVKDPVSFRYYRFREEELFLLRQFDGENNFDDIRHAFVEEFRPQRLSVVELEKFVQQLLQSGLANVDTPQVGQRLYERYQKKRKDKIKYFFTNILNIKFSLFDPDKLLTFMLRYVSFLFKPWFFALVCVFWLLSISLVLVNWDKFISMLPSYNDFFTPRNILYFWLTLAVVKILHEFGHGLSCKYFGGEVHEMGMLFLVMTPCLYANVTDSWMLPNKWHRAIIGAAGMYIEFLIAGGAVWVWFFTEPGMVKTLSLTVIFICSVSTFVFNANPLLRFDGYYILSDLLEIPNLRERANRLLGNIAGLTFLGTEVIDDPFMPKRNKGFFMLYAVASYIYRWLVTIGILWFFYNLLKPYKLASVSVMLAALSFIPLMILPVWNVIKTLRNRWRTLKVNKLRFIGSVSVALMIIGAISFVPLPMWIDVPVILQAKNTVTIYAKETAILAEIHVKDQDQAEGGMKLVRLIQPELQRQFDAFEAEERQMRGMINATRNVDSQNMQVLRSKHQAAKMKIDKARSQLEELNVLVPDYISGTVMLPPKKHELGKTFKAGDPICQIGDPKELEAMMVVQHTDIGLVKTQQNVTLKLNGHVGHLLTAKVNLISQDELQGLPPALSNKNHGEVPTKTAEGPHQTEVPLNKSFTVLANLPNDDMQWKPGTRGFARIHLEPASIYWRVKRYISQTWNFKL